MTAVIETDNLTKFFHFSTSVPLEAFAGLPGVRDAALNDSVLTLYDYG